MSTSTSNTNVNKNTNTAATLFAVISVVLCLWTPVYYQIVTCSTSNPSLILSSVPWLPWLRQSGFIAVTAIVILRVTGATGDNSGGSDGIGEIIEYGMLLGILILGIVVSSVVRYCFRGLRLQALRKSGLPHAMEALIDLESELFARGAFDSEWSLNNSTTYDSNTREYGDAAARRLWKARIKKISSARHLATALQEFETHVLCENLHPHFFRTRNTWHTGLNDIDSYAANHQTSAFDVVRGFTLDLKSHLRPLPKMQVIVHLIKQRMKRLNQGIPPFALHVIMQFMGAFSTQTVFQDSKDVAHTNADTNALKFQKYNENKIGVSLVDYQFPHDLKSTWTKGLWANHRHEKKYRRTTDMDTPILNLEVGSGAWFNSKFRQWPDMDKLPEVSWQSKAMYAQLMVGRVVYAVCKVEMVKDEEIQAIQMRIKEEKQPKERQETDTSTTGSRPPPGGEKKTSLLGAMGGMATQFGSMVGSAIVNKAADKIIGKWICRACTYENKALHVQCAMCQTSASDTPIQTFLQQEIFNTSDAPDERFLRPSTLPAVRHWKSMFEGQEKYTNAYDHKMFPGKNWNLRHLLHAKTIAEIIVPDKIFSSKPYWNNNKNSHTQFAARSNGWSSTSTFIKDNGLFVSYGGLDGGGKDNY